MCSEDNNFCEVFPIKRVSDARGWFVKPICGKEPGLSNLQGEFYLVMAEPGEIRGNHYHEVATEWFSVVQGCAELHLQDMATGKRSVVNLSAENPQSIVVKPDIAHAFLSPSGAREQMILTAFSNQIFDPSDTIPFKVI